jgi:4-hydroxy-3-polyprenylbenzoate decarboxylase
MKVEGSKMKVEKQRLIIGISGASGVILGIRAMEVLQQLKQIETHFVLSPAAKLTIDQETDWDLKNVIALADVVHNFSDIGASIASGSISTMGMVVLPCSIKTLSGIANSYADNLLARAADVTLKEGRPLVLAVRETPLHRGHLRLMDQAAEAGAIIFPPMPAFYAKPQSVNDIVDNIVGRVLARIGIVNEEYFKWKAFEDS